jgi:hypothetical protein
MVLVILLRSELKVIEGITDKGWGIIDAKEIFIIL